MLFSSGETPRKTKREPTTPTKSGAQNAWAGAQLVVASPVQRLARGTRSETAAGENNSFSFRNGGKAGIGERRSRARAHIGGTRFGSQCSRLLSRELEETDLGRSSHKPTATRKRGAGRRRGRRNERSEEEPGRGNEEFSRAKTGPPAEAIEGVVKTHRSFRLRTASQGEVRGNRKNGEHGCSWSGSGWHSSAARIAAFAG